MEISSIKPTPKSRSCTRGGRGGSRAAPERKERKIKIVISRRRVQTAGKIIVFRFEKKFFFGKNDILNFFLKNIILFLKFF